MNDRGRTRRRARAPVAPLRESTGKRPPAGFALFDRDWRLVTANASFAALRGYPRKLLKTGTPLEAFVRFDVGRGEYGAGASDTLTRTRLAALKRGRPAGREITLADGRIVRIACERLAEGGLGLTCEDLTDAHRTAERLRESDERLALAMRAAVEGIYEWNLETGILFPSHQAKAFFAIQAGEAAPSHWNERIHPDDFPAYRRAVIEYFKGGTPHLECEYRIRNAAGGYGWVLDRAVAVRNAAGRVTKLIGALSDVTPRKTAELELRRARDIANEALAEQTAVRELLEAISRSAFDLDAVLRTLVESATRLCRADKGFIFRLEGDAYHLAIDYGGVTPEFRDFEARHPMRPGRDTLIGRTALTRQVVHLPDVLADPEYRFLESQRLGGFRTMLGVPIVRDAVVIGVIALWKERVEPFTPAQIELVATFSTQAAIAIENARLFGETREALEQRTVTSETLGVIARSPTELQPVLHAVVEGAARLCEAHDVHILQVRGDALYVTASHGAFPITSPCEPVPISRGLVSGRAVLERQLVHVLDITSAEARAEFPESARFQQRFGDRTLLAMPLLREGTPIGLILLRRVEVHPFTDRQISLLKTFADQAVIAIENARLFGETREALEQQTATSEILRAIAGSPTDLQPVLDTVVRNAARLCEASNASLFRVEGDSMRRVAGHGSVRISLAIGESRPISRGSLSGRAILDRQVVNVPDFFATDLAELPEVRAAIERSGIRSCLAAPLVLEGTPIGALTVYRTEVRPFSDKQLDLIKLFADQAVIAIQNVRLFNETKEALEQQKASAEVLQVISSSVADTEPVFEKILESCERLFEGRNVGVGLVGDDGAIHLAGYHGPARDELERHYPLPLDENSGAGVAILRRHVVHYPDLGAAEIPSHARRGAQIAGFRSMLIAPMVWEGRGIGVIFVGRAAAGEFSAKETALLETFAHQAVIAIQNARLFNETKEALDHQKASAEVLQVISSSVADTEPVFEKILESCERLFDGLNAGVMLLGDDGQIHMRAYHGPGREELEQVGPFPLSEASAAGVAILRRDVVHFPDTEAAEMPEYGRRGTKVLGYKSLLQAPMVWEGRGIGSIFVGRRDVGTFSEKEIALLKTFADQAVIAIQNARLFNELGARNRELAESLEQQTATAEILRVISGSPTSTAPVFDAILETGARLCHADLSIVFAYDAGEFRLAAARIPDPAFEAFLRQPVRPGPNSGLGRIARTREAVHVADLLDDVAYRERDPLRVASVELGGARTWLGVPMLKDGELIGAIAVYRKEVRPFDERQIALLQTFADQAVIAVENVRLFNETKEALEKQTAISEILRVISSSPTDVQPVFDTIVRSAVKLCGSANGALFRYDGQRLHYAAGDSPEPEWVEAVRASYPMRPEASTIAGRAILTRSLVHIDDVLADPEYDRARAVKGGWRRMLAVPMVRDGPPLGVIVVSWTEAGPASKSQEDLLRTFADQAAIAIENVRLFQELQARNRELSEALEQQTATAEILRVISSSPTDIQPVLDAVAETAARLCDASDAVIFRVDRGLLRRAAKYGASIPAVRVDEGLPLDRTSVNSRAALEGRTIHVDDLVAEEAEYPLGCAMAKRDGFRTALATPLLREGQPLGTIHIRRAEVRPFSDRQIKLLEIFASQAVIAIENVRLFNETKEALEQQRASAEVLTVISNSMADARPVFDKIVESCERLFASSRVGLNLIGPDGLVHAGAYGNFPGAERLRKENYPHPVAGSATGAAIGAGQVVHYPDVLGDSDIPPYARRGAVTVGLRSFLMAPLLSEGRGLGAIFVGRETVGAFTEKEMVLLKTFADQAVIAIQNARLFNETKEALERQTATAEILKVISGSPTDVQPVFEAIVRSGVRLFEDAAVSVVRPEAGQVCLMAVAEGDPARAELWRTRFPFPISREYMHGAAILDSRLVEVPDVLDPAGGFEVGKQRLAPTGYRAMTVAPMLRDNVAIGAISVIRVAPGPLSDKQVALLKTFADQAVIAIENVRLFNETKEALERQTATAEILKVISSSPTDVQPVFDAITESGVRLFQGVAVSLRLVRGDRIERVAFAAAPGCEVIEDPTNAGLPLDDRSFAGRAVLRRELVHVPDIPAADWVGETSRTANARMGVRAIAAAPMVRDNKVLGLIAVTRAKAGAFSDRELALLTTFADQAVIAIENVRLFNETKEALDYQKASAEVLQVISSSVADAAPVFEKILESCQRLFGGHSVGITLVGPDGAVRLGAYQGRNREMFAQNFPTPLDASGTGAAIRHGDVMRYPDVDAPGVPAFARAGAKAIGFRSVMFAPLLWEGQGIGAIFVGRDAVGEFSEKEITLLKTFADQAVIAIQNARLFSETNEALERQTATAEILKVISASPTDVQPVFDAIVKHAGRLAAGSSVNVSRLVGERLELAAYTEVSPEADKALLRAYPIRLDEVEPIAEAVASRSPVLVGDWEGDSRATAKSQAVMRARGFRSTLYVPIVRGDAVYGVMHVSKLEPGPFPDHWVNMLRIFADQAVIAIENVRLFNETKEALDQQRASAEVLQVISGSVADAEPVFDKILESCERLFGGRHVGVNLVGEDGAVHLGQYRGPGRQALESMFPLPLSRESGSGAAILGRRVVHYQDIEHGTDVPDPVRRGGRAMGFRSFIFAPMLWEGRGIGAIWVGRDTVGGFSEKEISLLKTFADQAVIAIQNAKLFHEIQEKSHQLEIANQHKSAFLANMSHELRTPLNAVIGFSEMLNARYFGDLTEKQAEYVNDIHGSGKHLLSLINDILDLSKIEAGRMELEASDFDLRAALDNALTLVRERAQRGGIAVRLETDPALGALHGDERKVKQVVLNLLSNAVKFTPRGGAVDIVARKANGSAEIAVSDTGVGIAPADQEAIFEAFRQVGTDVTRKREGTGLGLALTRRFVELHGGTIRVESAPGKGSTFTVTLPLRHGE